MEGVFHWSTQKGKAVSRDGGLSGNPPSCACSKKLRTSIALTLSIQGPLGQPFTKPTSILAGRLSTLPGTIYGLYQPRWRPTEWVGGRDSSGKAWRTSKAKQYPPKLCQAIAMAHLAQAASLHCEGEEPDPCGLSEVLQSLAQPFDGYLHEALGTEMGQDYWGRNFLI